MSGLLAAGNGRRAVTTIGGLAHGTIHSAAIAGLAGGGTVCRARPRHHVRTCGPVIHALHTTNRITNRINGTDKG
jgi:hypothetical protein